MQLEGIVGLKENANKILVDVDWCCQYKSPRAVALHAPTCPERACLCDCTGGAHAQAEAPQHRALHRHRLGGHLQRTAQAGDHVPRERDDGRELPKCDAGVRMNDVVM